jgi:sulfate transport system substrate-binding protein
MPISTGRVVGSLVDFLFTKEAQEIFAKHGLRSPDPAVAESTAATYPPIEDLFTIEYFGGWKEATPILRRGRNTYKVFEQVRAF